MTDSEYDVVVIGSGIAGSSAAPAANQRRNDACVPTDAFTSHAIPQHRITGRVCHGSKFLALQAASRHRSCAPRSMPVIDVCAKYDFLKAPVTPGDLVGERKNEPERDIARWILLDTSD
jgi:hypothetical protein